MSLQVIDGGPHQISCQKAERGTEGGAYGEYHGPSGYCLIDSVYYEVES